MTNGGGGGIKNYRLEVLLLSCPLKNESIGSFVFIAFKVLYTKKIDVVTFFGPDN